jgi:hypothetical protein
VAVLADIVAEGSSGQKEPAQEQQATSDPDSPMLDPNKKQGRVDLETAAHDGVFNQFVADQLLSKGQRINIGSPDTYFRPAYATAAGVKSAPDTDVPSQSARGRLQVNFCCISQNLPPMQASHGWKCCCSICVDRPT